MSYDLTLVRVPPHASPDDVAAMVAKLNEEDDVDQDRIDPVAEALKARLVTALRAANPRFQPFKFDHAVIAEHAGVSVEEAQRKYRDVELNDEEVANGIQMTLYDSFGSLTVPYWHAGRAAVDVWKEIWTYLRILRDHGDLVPFDLQLDRVLQDTAADLESVLAQYSKGVVITRRASRESSDRQPKNRPWWRFW